MAIFVVLHSVCINKTINATIFKICSIVVWFRILKVRALNFKADNSNSYNCLNIFESCQIVKTIFCYRLTCQFNTHCTIIRQELQQYSANCNKTRKTRKLEYFLKFNFGNSVLQLKSYDRTMFDSLVAVKHSCKYSYFSVSTLNDYKFFECCQTIDFSCGITVIKLWIQ